MRCAPSRRGCPFLKSERKELLSAIVSTGKIEKATEEGSAAAIQEFKDRFVKENAGARPPRQFGFGS